MYGCYNREPLKDKVWVQDGWFDTEINGEHTIAPAVVMLPDPMTKHCNYTHTELGQADKGCVGCKHRVQKETNETDQLPS